MTTTFAKESEMTASAARWLRTEGFALKEEFVSPWGICDLVGVKLDPDRVAHRLGYGQVRRIGSITSAALLLGLPDADTGRDRAIQRVVRDWSPAISEGAVVEEIGRLEKDGFVRRTSGGGLQKLNGWIPLQEALVAVELKLSRIDEAMRQARQNLGFADLSLVGFPSDVAKKIATAPHRWKQYFDEGIGLLDVGVSRCRTLIPARRISGRVDPAIQMYCVDKFWKQVSKGS